MSIIQMKAALLTIICCGVGCTAGCADEESSRLGTNNMVASNNSASNNSGSNNSGSNNSGSNDSPWNNTTNPECRVVSLQPFQNQCAVFHNNIATWRTGELAPVPIDLGLALAWSYQNQCPIDDNIKLTSLVVKGDMLTALDQRGGLATLSRATGKQLACFQTEIEFGISLPLDDTPKVAVFSTVFEPYDVVDRSIEWVFVDPFAPESTIRNQIRGCYLISQTGGVRQAPDGQIIAESKQPRGIVSVDPITGAVNWGVDYEELAQLSVSTDGFYTTPYGMGFDAATRELIIDLGGGKTVGVDSCGAIRARPDATPATIIEFSGGRFEVMGAQLKVYDSASELIAQDTCDQLLTLSEDTVACIKRVPSAKMNIVVFESGKPERELLVNGSLNSNIVATRDGVLILPGLNSIGFYDWRNGVMIGSYELPDDMGRGRVFVSDVGEDGRILLGQFDKIYAIDSNLTGLAPGRFPRGFSDLLRWVGRW